MSGTLTVCGTPIGNLEDISLRVLRILKEADVIAAEDTRHTLKLLNHYGIKTPLTSYHEHNKREKGIQIVTMLQNGKNIALVSDAGMPAVSDPGYELVTLCYEKNITVTTAPGPTAMVSALVLSGFSTGRAVFEGFLPANKKRRAEIIQGFQTETRTVVLYEAPHHLKLLLEDLDDALGERNIAVVRELTKKHEQVHRGTLSELKDYFDQNEPKGEIAVVIEGLDEKELTARRQQAWNTVSARQHVRMYEQEGYTQKEAMKRAAKDRGLSKREIYAQMLKKR